MVKIEQHWNVYEEPEEPGILRVNRQTRREAGPIFDENRFQLNIFNLDLQPSRNHWCFKKDSLYLILFDSRDWRNLKRWLKEYHGARKNTPRVLGDEVTHTQQHVLQAFNIVDYLRDEPWTKVETILKLYREGVNAVADPDEGFD